MLHLHRYSHLQAKSKWLDQFDQNHTTWLVSDLKSKQSVEQILLARDGFVIDQAVMRASELWQKLFLRLEPNTHLVSDEYLTILQKKFFENHEEVMGLPPSWPRVVLDLLSQLASVFEHPEGYDLLTEWVETENELRWKAYLPLAREFWQMLRVNKIASPRWLNGMLVHRPEVLASWQRSLIVDLSFAMVPIESELLQIISQDTQVDILKPEVAWADEYKKLFQAYAEFVPSPSKEVLTESRAPVSVELRRFTSQLGEVKESVAQVRQWLEAGINPNRIAILAPDIEVYWSVLNSYLTEEGIGFQKPITMRLLELPSVQKWLAQLRLKVGDLNKFDLEKTLFHVASPLISYATFQSYYSEIDQVADLQRSSVVGEQIHVSSLKLISFAEFLDWINETPHDLPRDVQEKVWEALYLECETKDQFLLSDWLDYLQAKIKSISLRGAESDFEGIHCHSLLAGDDLNVSHVLLLGMTEEQLQAKRQAAIGIKEARQIKQDVGFEIAAIDNQILEAQTQWLLGQSFDQLIMMCATTDFSGEVLSPSTLWLRLAAKQGLEGERKVHVPALTLWDRLQLSPLQSIANYRQWQEERAEPSIVGLVPGVRIKQLSASGLESYLECPFVYFSQKLLHLDDPPQVSMDLDLRTKGTLHHRLAEKLMANLNGSNEIIEQLVLDALGEISIPLADHRSKQVLFEKLKSFAFRFVQTEKQFRQDHPNVKKSATEVKIKGFWNQLTGGFSTQPQEESAIKVTGSIDRVDLDEAGHAVIIDYKSSDANLHQMKSWINNRELQLAIYSLALESGLSDLKVQKVVGAQYYSFATLTRTKGLFLSENFGLYAAAKGDTEEKKQEMLTNLKELTTQSIKQIVSGHFAAHPVDIETCERCAWRRLCRAPHLQ